MTKLSFIHLGYRHEKKRGRADTVRGNLMRLREFSASFSASVKGILLLNLPYLLQFIGEISFLYDNIGMLNLSAFFTSVSTYQPSVNIVYTCPHCHQAKTKKNANILVPRYDFYCLLYVGNHALLRKFPIPQVCVRGSFLPFLMSDFAIVIMIKYY